MSESKLKLGSKSDLDARIRKAQVAQGVVSSSRCPSDTSASESREGHRGKPSDALGGGGTLGEGPRRELGERKESEPERAGLGIGLRVSVEIPAGVGIGAFIGWHIDRFFDSGPLALIGLTLLGFCGAILNVIRIYEAEEKRRQNQKKGRLRN